MCTERTEYMMKDLEFLEHVIDQKSQMILDANDRIWEYAELAYHETRSADLLCQILKDEGFSVTTGDAGIPTCFTGTFSYGSGKPVMGILGEYDALSSLSQKAASPRKEPVEAGAPGHGCGHSALGTGSLAAVLAVKEYLVENKKDGTIIYFGCPAEEGAGSKQFMGPGRDVRQRGFCIHLASSHHQRRGMQSQQCHHGSKL